MTFLLDIRFLMERTEGDDTPGTWHQVSYHSTGRHRAFTACKRAIPVRDTEEGFTPVKFSDPGTWDLYKDILCPCVKHELTDKDVETGRKAVIGDMEDYGDW